MVDLYCAESLALSSKHAFPDPVMFSQSAGLMMVDENESVAAPEIPDCLQSLRAIEQAWTASCNYFENNKQPDLKPYMRKMVVEWLLEVCKEQHCEDEVFPVTVNLVDRFLAVQYTPKNEFQLLGSACLLIASKLRETASLPAEKICKYTENSITVEQLYAFEMFVLDRLQWDLGVVTAHELCDHMMYRLFSDPTAPMFNRIRRHCRALLDLAQTDFTFALQPASLLAASAIMSSLCHFGFSELFHPEGDNIVYQQVGELVGVEAELLAYWSIELENLRASFIAQHSSAPVAVDSPDSGVSSPYNQSLDVSNVSPSYPQQSNNKLPATPVRTSENRGEDLQPRTPTDVAELFDE